MPLNAILKLLLLLLWVIVLFPPVYLCWLCRLDRARKFLIPVFYRGLLHIVGVRLRMEGALSETRPLMLVTNHVSYLDVPIIGSVAPVSFVPKAEIAGWPVIGFLCKLAECVFIERSAGKVKDARDEMLRKIKEGHVLCLFPEGTTTLGKQPLTFKSSLFNLAEQPLDGQPLAIQPACIAYTHINNLPVDETQRPRIAWIGDISLAPHAWDLLKLGTIRASIIFHPPVTIAQFASRKELAAHCQAMIAQEMERARGWRPRFKIN